MSKTHKLLYIAFLKVPKKLKNKKKKWKKNLSKSRLNNLKNKKTIYFFYKKIKDIKKWVIGNKKKTRKQFQFLHNKINKLFKIYKKRKILNLLKKEP